MVEAWLEPAPLDEIEAAHIGQFARFLSGARDQVADLTGYTGTGTAVKIRGQNAAVVHLDVRHSSDSHSLLTVTDTGVEITGLTFPTGDQTISGALTVQGATTLQSTLSVTGETTIQSGLTVDGAALIIGNLEVGGTSYLTGAVTTPSALRAGWGGNTAPVIGKRNPALAFFDQPGLGWYPFNLFPGMGALTNVMDIGTPAPGVVIPADVNHTSGAFPFPDTEQHVLVGAGNHIANGVITISKAGMNRSTAQVVPADPYPVSMSGLVVYQGSDGLPVAQFGDLGAIRSQSTVVAHGGALPTTSIGARFDITAEQGVGANGNVIGMQATGKSSILMPVRASLIGLKAVATTEVNGQFPKTLTGAQINADGLTVAGDDVIHVMEANVGTSAAPPSSRTVLVLSTKAQARSRRAAPVTSVPPFNDAGNPVYSTDAVMSWSRKPFGPTAGSDSVIEVAPFSYGITLWNGFNSGTETEGAGTYPFDATSTLIAAPPTVAAGRQHALKRGFDFRTVDFASDQYISKNFCVNLNGWLGVGITAPNAPLHVNYVGGVINNLLQFTGTTASFTQATCAAYPGSPSGFLKVMVGSVPVVIPYFAP